VSKFANIVIRASAGSGKTFQLANRFIALAADGAPVDQILATTFTRKAAGEILDRVLLRLAEAATDNTACSELAKFIQRPDLTTERCEELLLAMIDSLHRLRICTLDSFFSQVAGSFGLELGLPPGWRIVDQVDEQRLRDEAIRAMLQGETTGEIATLVSLLSKGEATRSISQQIRDTVVGLYSEYQQTDEAAWQIKLPGKPLSTDKLQMLVEALSTAELPDDKRFHKAREEDLNRITAEQWPLMVQKGLASKVAAGETKYYRKEIPPPTVALYQQLVKHAKAVLVGQLASQTHATWQLLDRFDVPFARLKTLHRALRFDDVTHALGSSVASDAARMAFRLDARIRHLLLDEFQDTSLPQWNVLRPMAQALAEEGTPGSFFCVGDVKQAIYGWRGGNAEIFDALEHHVRDLEEQPLDVSYRSSPVVIDAVNQAFESLRTNTVLDRYRDATDAWAMRYHTHSTARTELPGHVVLATVRRAEGDEKQDTVTLQSAAGAVARLVEETPEKTIGVLVRTNDAVARLIYELRQRGVRASEEGGNPLSDSPAVQTLLSLLRLADHPGDQVSRFHVAHSPLAEPMAASAWQDDARAAALSHEVRRSLLRDGYGPTFYRWMTLLAPSCNERDLRRLSQLVEQGYDHDGAATLRPTDFIEQVESNRVADPTDSGVRVMTLHQAKGLQFDIVVLPQLDKPLIGQRGVVVTGRADAVSPVEQVCRYTSKEVQQLLSPRLQSLFAAAEADSLSGALCFLYVAMTRPVHALHMLVAPAKENERNLPTTFAGVLRAALAPSVDGKPDTILFEAGTDGWHESDVGRPPTSRKETPKPKELRLAPSPAVRRRNLPSRSPSTAKDVHIADLLQADRGGMQYGKLIHAWFEQIEWLDDGVTGAQQLRKIAASSPTSKISFETAVSQFHEMLKKPRTAKLLSRGFYEQPDASDFSDELQRVYGEHVTHLDIWQERRFVIIENGCRVEGMIDRLVLAYQGDHLVAAEIIDFKTDKFDASDPAAFQKTVEQYRPQIEAYRRAIIATTGLKPQQITARLLFVGPGRLQSL